MLDNYATHKHPKVLKWLAKRAHHQPQTGKRDKHEHRQSSGLVRQHAPLQFGGVGNVGFYGALLDRLLQRLSPALQQGVPTRFMSTAIKKSMKTHLCATPGGSTRQTGCIRAMSATNCRLAHCKSRRRCRSGWRPWLGDNAVLPYSATAAAMGHWVTASAVYRSSMLDLTPAACFLRWPARRVAPDCLAAHLRPHRAMLKHADRQHQGRFANGFAAKHVVCAVGF